MHFIVPLPPVGRQMGMLSFGASNRRGIPMLRRSIIVTVTALAIAIASGRVVPARQTTGNVSIRVDTGKRVGAMTPIWAWYGHDEPNYTYTPNGKKLLSALAAANAPVPVYMRVHNLFTTGDGKYALKWGSTNAYTEDASGKPIYDWKIVDQIIDSYVERKMKPM